MQLRKRLQILLLDIGQQRRPNYPGVVHDMRNRKASNDIGGGALGRRAIHEIDLYRVQPGMRLSGLAPSKRNDLVARLQHLPANFRADAG